MNKNSLKALVIIFSILVLAGCGKSDKKIEESVSKGNTTITLSDYDKIKKGMSYEEVKKVINGVCNKTSEEGDITIYACSGKMAGAKAELTFKNNSLIEKTETGLK